MDYFALLPIARYEEDNEGISILSIARRERISFNKEKSEVLKKIIAEPLPKDWEMNELITSIIDEIIGMGMGYIYERKVYFEEYRSKREFELKGLLQRMPLIEKMYIDLNGPRIKAEQELTSNRIISNKCKSCMSGINNKNIFCYDEIIKSIDRAILLSVKEYVIIGGDPFGRRDELITILKKIRKNREDADIVIQTNGMYLNENIEIIKKYELKIVLSVFEKAVSDKNDEYIDKIKIIIKKLKDNNVSYDITFVGESDSHVKERIQECGIVFTNEAQCYLRGKKIDYFTSEERSKMFLDEYIENDIVSGCLDKIITISAEGRFKVCPHMDDITDINPYDLDYIFENDLQNKYWKRKKKDYLACCKCRFANCCKNCILLDESIKNNDMLLAEICDKMP